MQKIKLISTVLTLLLVFSSCSDDEELIIEVSTSGFNTFLDENAIKGQSVGFIEGVTNRGSVTFAITQQSPIGAFEINSSTGELTVLNESLFDFESISVITAVVKVAIGSIYSNSLVKVTLIDVNEIVVSASDFEFYIRENPLKSQSIGIVEGTTNEGEVTFTLTEQMLSGALEINPSTGELTVLNESLFDFEINPIITAVVKVANGGTYENSNVTINLVEIIYTDIQTIAYPTVNDSDSGAACVDLFFSNTAVVAHQLNVTVTYYETLDDANNETNVLGRYYSTPTFPHTIYARVDSTIDNSFDIAENELGPSGHAFSCDATGSFSGSGGGGQGPPGSGPGPCNGCIPCDPPPPPVECYLKVCDADGDGIEYVNLKQIQCASTRDYPYSSFCESNEEDVEKSFYLSHDDAKIGVNEIDNLFMVSEFNSVITIYQKYLNTSTSEYSINSTINITMVNCTDDTDGDGIKDMDEDPNGNLDYTDDDTDLDGIPNYLDDDDDGDGVLTINEDLNKNGDPTDDDRNDNSIADYLEANVTN